MRVMQIIGGMTMLALSLAVPAEELPLFDAHIHYSENAWPLLSPPQAIDRLRQAGIVRALVSSTSDDGTQMLFQQAPDLVIPSLRPYRQNSDQWGWVHDETIIPSLVQLLRERRYIAIGELHVYGSDADLPNVREIVKLARQYSLFVHAHSDADAVRRVFRHDGSVRILWAHAGFEEPDVIDRMLERYPNLWCELSMRNDVANDAFVTPAWRKLLTAYPERFLIGSDTYVPEQWDAVVGDARRTRQWLLDLPPVVRERIAYRNGEELFTRSFRVRPSR